MLELRSDLRVIADLVPHGATLLDAGCGDGELLAWLLNNKAVKGRGIELRQESVNQAISLGLSVIQGDVNIDLRDYPSGAFDVVILSQTLQAMSDPKAVLFELLRIGRQAIVSVPNFGQWRNRLYLGVYGKMPVTKTLTYEWYDTPNIHFCTITDFVELCGNMQIEILQRVVVSDDGTPSRFTGKGMLANFFGQQGVFLLSKQPD